MILKHLKIYFLKKKLERKELKSSPTTLSNSFKTIGLLIDKKNLNNYKSIKNELIKNGYKKENIKKIIYSNSLFLNPKFAEETYNTNHLNWKGKIISDHLKKFTATSFDILINYYDRNNIPMLFTTLHSKAKLKVGFANVDYKLNDFMINTNIDKPKVFIEELQKFLKVLNNK